MPKSITRVADLCKVFRGGTDPLMNDIATICILYEDFRFELANLKCAIDVSSVGNDQESYYWIRRLLLTMHEFAKRLQSLLKNPAHKEILDGIEGNKRDTLAEAKRAFNKSPLEKLRNAFGGHADPDKIGAGIQFYGSGAVSKMTWTDTYEELPLKIDFAYDIFRGAFAGHFAPNVDDLKDKLQTFYRNMGELFTHVANVTLILVHEFVWVKFG